jgi:hypothetical protein
MQSKRGEIADEPGAELIKADTRHKTGEQTAESRNETPSISSQKATPCH